MQHVIQSAFQTTIPIMAVFVIKFRVIAIISAEFFIKCVYWRANYSTAIGIRQHESVYTGPPYNQGVNCVLVKVFNCCVKDTVIRAAAVCEISAYATFICPSILWLQVCFFCVRASVNNY